MVMELGKSRIKVLDDLDNLRIAGQIFCRRPLIRIYLSYLNARPRLYIFGKNTTKVKCHLVMS
jgi:hypothetical protein